MYKSTINLVLGMLPVKQGKKEERLSPEGVSGFYGLMKLSIFLIVLYNLRSRKPKIEFCKEYKILSKYLLAEY